MSRLNNDCFAAADWQVLGVRDAVLRLLADAEPTGLQDLLVIIIDADGAATIGRNVDPHVIEAAIDRAFDELARRLDTDEIDFGAFAIATEALDTFRTPFYRAWKSLLSANDTSSSPFGSSAHANQTTAGDDGGRIGPTANSSYTSFAPTSEEWIDDDEISMRCSRSNRRILECQAAEEYCRSIRSMAESLTLDCERWPDSLWLLADTADADTDPAELDRDVLATALIDAHQRVTELASDGALNYDGLQQFETAHLETTAALRAWSQLLR